MFRNRIIQVMIFFLLIIAIAAPVSTYITYMKYGYFEEEGANPFQYWLLNYTVGWGAPAYFRLFFVFPILSTGLNYFFERSSSMREVMLTRMRRQNFYISKILSVFLFSLFIFSAFFLCNTICTHICFRGEEITDYYKDVIPMVGSFAETFYKISPLFMEVIYGLLNALAQAILAVIALALQINLNFKNKYAAFIGSFFIMYGFNYICEIVVVSFFNKPFLSLSGIVQPSVCWALITAPTKADVIFIFAGAIVLMAGCILVGIHKNEDILG